MEPDMNLGPRLLQGHFFDLEPLSAAHEGEMRQAMNCDAERWNILYTCGMGAHFASHWQGMIATPRRLTSPPATRRRDGLRGPALSFRSIPSITAWRLAAPGSTPTFAALPSTPRQNI